MTSQDKLLDEIPRLRRYARALLRDPVAADDLVQDCLERALSRWHQWQSGSNLRAWLFRIMHSQFINQRRQESRRLDRDELDASAESNHAAPASQEIGFEFRDMQRALERLSPDHREVVLLIALENLSYREVADILDVPVGTVMSRLSRGRENLRKHLADAERASLRRVK